MVRASRYNANRSDRACILDLSSIRRRRCDPCPLREDHEKAKAADDDPDFSHRIRDGVIGF
jgi:hypothetical protein